MPLVPFDRLPDDARLWVFGASAPLVPNATASLMDEVEGFLSRWEAHALPLTCGREWRDERFLVVGVDQSTAGASGCSIDALYRILQRVEQESGLSLLPGGRVFYRDATGAVQGVDRTTFVALVRAGVLTPDTPVFDTTLTDAASYRARFERPLRDSWHARLAP